jgi:hypothetical protein
MPYQPITIGDPDDPGADSAYAAFTKANANFAELYAGSSSGAPGTGTVFVSKLGSDSNNGLSWGSAKLTIAAAIGVLGGENAPRGTVYIGPGTYNESNLPCNEGMQFVGHGTSFNANGGTRIIQANGANQHIFRKATTVTAGDYFHGTVFRNIHFGGNRENNTAGSLVYLPVMHGGWGMAFYDCHFNRAPAYGVYHTGNCLDLSFFNCVFTKCSLGATYSEMTAGAGYTWAMYGSQVDDCGNAANAGTFTFRDNTTSYDLRQVSIYDTKVEQGVTSDGVGDPVISLESVAQQAKGFRVNVVNLNVMRLDAATMATAIVREYGGHVDAQESRVTLRNVSGRRYTNVFYSAKTALTIQGEPLRSYNNPATADTNSRQVYEASTHRVEHFSGVERRAGSGVPTMTAPNGSLYQNTAGVGTADNLYVRRGGAWVGIA